MYTTHGVVIVTLIAAGLVMVNVLLHYEVLSLLSQTLGKLAWVGRLRIALLICALLVVHIAEITTVVYGDLLPTGPMRFIAAMEALLGLMLITWSASFTYLEMQRFWRDR